MFVKHDYTARKHANNARKAYLQCSYHDNSGPNHDHHNHNHSTHDHHGHVLILMMILMMMMMILTMASKMYTSDES